MIFEVTLFDSVGPYHVTFDLRGAGFAITGTSTGMTTPSPTTAEYWVLTGNDVSSRSLP